MNERSRLTSRDTSAPLSKVSEALQIENRFSEMSMLLQEYIQSIIGSNNELMEGIAKETLNVVQNCNRLSFDDHGAAEAYVIMHFLDRFHRFQLIFDELGKMGLLQTRVRRFDALDIGTGPGPSMYALSDFLLKKQIDESEHEEERLSESFSIDYVEKSSGFRNWLHSFTEFANLHCWSQIRWKVPYHFGAYNDFTKIMFDSLENVKYISNSGTFGQSLRTVKRRYNLIVFSNFLTNEEMVEQYKEEILACARYLRHGGILLIVGARSSDSRYQKIYDKLDKILTNGRYSNWKFRAWCKRVDLHNPVMSYSWGDDFGSNLKETLKVAYKKLDEMPGLDFSIDARNEFHNRISTKNAKDIAWQVIAYRKYAIPKSKVRSNQI